MNTILGRFFVRWFVCGLGLWIAAGVVGADKISYQGSLMVIVGAGLVLAIINTLIKPILVFFSLPALLFSLGLFMIIINAITVLLASHLYTELEVDNFGTALVAGIVIGLVNWLVTTILEGKE